LIPGPTPLHLVEAPSPGSGKGLLVDVAVRIATGRDPALMSPPTDDADWRKKITSHLRNAPSAILIDNISRTLDSDALATVLTSLTWQDRLLGTNDEIRLPVRCVWIATGNNPTVSTDMLRRIARIRIHPPVDRPWERESKEFRHPKLSAWAVEHRAALLHACLTLGQAWIAAGKPMADLTIGSYEQWAAVMGGILDVAGIPGFMANRLEFYEQADVEGTVWRAFVAAWWEGHQAVPVGVAALLPIAEATEGFDLGKSDLIRAQRTVLGRRLAKYRDRVLGEYRIVSAGIVHKTATWQLLPTTSKSTPKEEAAAKKGEMGEIGGDIYTLLRAQDDESSNARTHVRACVREPHTPRPDPGVNISPYLPHLPPCPKCGQLLSEPFHSVGYGAAPGAWCGHCETTVWQLENERTSA